MKNILAISISTFLSFLALGQEKVEHECVPNPSTSDFSKVLIVYEAAGPYGKEFLKLYDSEGLLKRRLEVQYGDDMTYIAYSNEIEKIYFERDWPVEKDRGPGSLQLGSWNDALKRPKIYQLDCFSPALSQGRQPGNSHSWLF